MTASDDFEREPQSIPEELPEEDYGDFETDDPKAQLSMQFLGWYGQYTSPIYAEGGSLLSVPGAADKNARSTANAALEYLRTYLDGSGKE